MTARRALIVGPQVSGTPVVRWGVRQSAWSTAWWAWASPEPRSLDGPDARV